MKRVDAPATLPRRDVAGHKGSFGTVVGIAGSAGMLGAAILLARGALRGGAGLMRAALPAELMAPFTVAVPAATTLDRDAAMDQICVGAAAVVCGPGLPPDEARRLVAALQSEAPVVLDAGALEADTVDICTARRRVLTPHPGEAARLLGSTTRDVQADREGAVRALVARYSGVVVLKGAGTLCCDSERFYQNTTGNPGLGTGGTGDVLAGLLGACLAQGMEPFDAACCAVHTHGAAGDLVASRLSEPGLCAEDLPLAIAEVLGR